MKFSCIPPSISLQVSHHPPIAACHCESPNFTFWQGMYMMPALNYCVVFPWSKMFVEAIVLNYLQVNFLEKLKPR